MLSFFLSSIPAFCDTDEAANVELNRKKMIFNVFMSFYWLLSANEDNGNEIG